MRKKHYFLPGPCMLVYVHDETETDLIVGMITYFMSDAKTGILRNSVSKEDFQRYKPIVMDSDEAISKYLVRETRIGSNTWRVPFVSQNKNPIRFFPEARTLPNAEWGDHHKP